MPSAFDEVYTDLKVVEAEVNALVKETTTILNYWGSGDFDRSAAEMLADAKNALKLYTSRDAVLKAAKGVESVFTSGVCLGGITGMGRVVDDLEKLI